jgi:hypothetical protein
MRYPASVGGYHDSSPPAELPSIRTLHTILTVPRFGRPPGAVEELPGLQATGKKQGGF